MEIGDSVACAAADCSEVDGTGMAYLDVGFGVIYTTVKMTPMGVVGPWPIGYPTSAQHHR